LKETQTLTKKNKFIAMYRIDDNNRNGVLSNLINTQLTSLLDTTGNAFTQIRSMEMEFRTLSRNPDTIRVMSQLEFQYEGVVDGSDKRMPANREPLKTGWFDSTFAVADPSECHKWCQKACSEAAMGKTIALLIPARTGTSWFHELVFNKAAEVRFIKGSVVLTGSARPNTTPDCLVIYRSICPGAPLPRQPQRTSVAILNLNTSFTATESSVKVLTDEIEEDIKYIADANGVRGNADTEGVLGVSDECSSSSSTPSTQESSVLDSPVKRKQIRPRRRYKQRKSTLQ
jgi:hypothetical protein